jgi:hypothetical protein
MAAEPKQLHPAMQYLKDNIVVIGLVVIVAASLAVFAFTQSKAEAKPAADVKPAPVATAALDNSPSPGATAATGATPSTAGTTGAPAGAGSSQEAAQPTPAATRAPAIDTNAKSLEAKDWRLYAEAFSKAWATTSDGKDAWLGRLKPMVSPDLYAGFTRTDISTIPTDPYENISMAEESKASKTFRAYSTHGQMFEGRVSVQADGSWVVDQVGPPAK